MLSNSLQAPLWGYIGSALAIGLSCLGSAYGTAKSGTGVVSGAVIRPDMTMKLMFPVIATSLIGVFGFLVALIIVVNIKPEKGYHLFQGFAHFGAGLGMGLPAIAAGLALGICGDSGSRAVAKQPSIFTTMMVTCVFGDALCILGFVMALMATLKSDSGSCTRYIE